MGAHDMNIDWLKPAPDSIAGRHVGAGKVRALVLMNLVWIGWLFGDLIFSDQPLRPSWWYSTFISLPFFLGLYWLCYCRPAREIVRYASGMAVLAFTLLMFNNSGASTYLIFCCAYLGFAPSSRRAIAYVLIAAGCFAIATQLRHWPVAITATMCFIGITVGMGNTFYRLNWQREAELKLSHEEVRRLAATAERERIGRDLHDLLGHTLSLITLKLELSRRLFDRDPEAAKMEVEEAERVARHALAEVRSAVTGIRTTGIAAELASCKLLLNASGVFFSYTNEAGDLPSNIEAALALILREAVTNIHRHAGASRADASIRNEAGVLTFCVADNGRGGVGDHGNGLCGMRERAKALGGQLEIESRRGHGTRVSLRIPMPILRATPHLGLVPDLAADQASLPSAPARQAS
jgi:two-component system, NarL family, sensor histidine kinase DesK